MDIAHFKSHLPSIEGGRWVGADEVPDLLGVRVKIRGASSDAARAAYAKREREAPINQRDAKGKLRPEAMIALLNDVLAEWNLVDVEGLTSGGEPVTVEQLREMIRRPEYRPLADLLMQAVAVVDDTRETQIEGIAGN